MNKILKKVNNNSYKIGNNNPKNKNAYLYKVRLILIKSCSECRKISKLKVNLKISSIHKLKLKIALHNKITIGRLKLKS